MPGPGRGPPRGASPFAAPWESYRRPAAVGGRLAAHSRHRGSRLKPHHSSPFWTGGRHCAGLRVGGKVSSGRGSRRPHVLVLPAHGMSDAEIAERLSLSEAPVKAHVGHVRSKLACAIGRRRWRSRTNRVWSHREASLRPARLAVKRGCQVDRRDVHLPGSYSVTRSPPRWTRTRMIGHENRTSGLLEVGRECRLPQGWDHLLPKTRGPPSGPADGWLILFHRRRAVGMWSTRRVVQATR